MSSPSFVLPGLLARVPAVVLSFLLLTACIMAADTRAGTEAGMPWIEGLRRYAAQKEIENDRSYAPPANLELRWAGLLQSLPPPEEWPALRGQLVSAAEKEPDGVERSRLQAGVWLLGYMLGEKDKLLAGLPATPEDPVQASPATYAIENLRQTLARPQNGEAPLQEEVQRFEEQLAMLEPVDVEAVKRALGGEENFARLHRLIEAGKAVQGRMRQIQEDYEKTKDEAAARQKMEELHKEFEAAHGADQAALEPYQNEPLFGRYMASLYRQEMSADYTPSLQLPDLVTGIGAERAEALLRRALQLPVKLSLNKQSGEATSRLARELTLAGVASLKVPSWGLTHDTAAAALFEALLARFGEPTKSNELNEHEEPDYEFQQARGYYLAALIGQGRVAEAVQLATRPGGDGSLNLPYQVLEALERSGQAEALWQFLHAWLTRHPAAGEWDRFNRLSAQLDRQAELKTLIRNLAEQGAFAGIDRLRVQRMQADVELASDDLEAAERRLRALLAPPARTVEEMAVQMDVAEKLIQLADLQGNAEGITTVTTAAEAVLMKCRELKPEKVPDLAAGLVTVLNSVGRLEAGEKISREALAGAAELKKAAAQQSEGHVSSYQTKKLAVEQLRALTGLERWTDAARLLQESPWWGVGDIGDLLQETVDSDRKPVGYHVAQIALKQGRPEQARKILEAQLVVAPGADAVYESYLALAGQDARPLLARLAATDRYQERPLIWQARLHLDAKEVDQAVAALEAAIAIDPSDGEQGRGDRMRVYALLARAVAARGDAAKATFLGGVVKAIRLSETADRWFDAGAYARAIRLYREALGFFQDAYCIQSRLAVRLAGEGRMDEAAEHYRRAFELMPDSFGRVESHCFGCEHVFSSGKAQGVAEEVFMRMLAARPDKPQLHYLLGYLRQEQERPAEAAEHYRKAVQLDPLYLNAWNKLAGLEDELKFTSGQTDDLMLKLLELDPTRRHASPQLERVSDLPRLWHALAVARRVLSDLPMPDKLGELAASKAELKSDGDSYAFLGRQSLGTDFGTVLGEHRFVQALQQYLAALNAPREE